MDIKTYIKTLTPIERAAFAKGVGTSVAYLYQLAGGHRSPSTKLAQKIETVSGGLVRKEVLRPDVWPLADYRGPERRAHR